MRLTLAAFLLLIGFGLFALGHTWAPIALEILPDNEVGYWLELIVPFLPMLFVGGGAFVLAGDRQ